MLAIIIPYYKLTFFEATLKSLANQTDKRFKVYIGNDASLENPEAVLNKFSASFKFEYKKFEKNLGSLSLTQQWERCIAMSKSEEWLMVLGDDDVLGKNVVETFYRHINTVSKQNINLIRFASQIINDTGKETSKVYINPELEKATDAYFKKFKWEARSSLSEYIFSRKNFEAFGFTHFPLAWHSDDKAWLDFTKGGLIYSVNEAIIQIRESNESISGKTDNINLKTKSTALFLQNTLINKSYMFSKHQKTHFLFDFGEHIKEVEKINLKNTFIVFYGFLKMGSFYNGFRFLRRMYRAKFLKK
ncbi:glycosyltransferase [Algibacter sp. PT7-4]|uniref:glycosyltransferase n=1 Tax=Algibacter ulvanivorans TaxID=3400999 RepID=UPI003AAEE1B7